MEIDCLGHSTPSQKTGSSKITSIPGSTIANVVDSVELLFDPHREDFRKKRGIVKKTLAGNSLMVTLDRAGLEKTTTIYESSQEPLQI